MLQQHLRLKHTVTQHFILFLQHEKAQDEGEEKQGTKKSKERNGDAVYVHPGLRLHTVKLEMKSRVLVKRLSRLLSWCGYK